MARTFAACSPLGPWLVSNSTFCPSSRFRYPVPEIALKCTNTSGPPPSWVMKPKPFSPLNHFTVPVAIDDPLLSWPESTWGSHKPWPGSFEPEGDHPKIVALGEHHSAANGSMAQSWKTSANPVGFPAVCTTPPDDHEGVR